MDVVGVEDYLHGSHTYAWTHGQFVTLFDDMARHFASQRLNLSVLISGLNTT